MNQNPSNEDATIRLERIPRDLDATTRLERGPRDPDATIRLERGPRDPDATIRLERIPDATKLRSARSAARLYRRAAQVSYAAARDSTQPEAPSEQPLPLATADARPGEKRGEPREKRSLLAAWRRLHRHPGHRDLLYSGCVIGLVLLLLLLISGAISSGAHPGAQQQNGQVGTQLQRQVGDTINADAIRQAELAQREAASLLQQFHREVAAWGNAHQYHDPYNGRDYALDNGYMHDGIGASLDEDFANAGTTADFAAVITEADNALFDLNMLEADFADQTPYNQAHASDLRLLDYYQLQQKDVMLVSLVEQVMRVYQNGKLVRAFYITTGRQELPSLPGIWSVQTRQSPVIFKAADPKGSPYWFPDTLIHYAILYHWGGYFIHDAPWRANFGPGTQFPHHDASGTTAYNFDGSHGCINLTEDAAAWVYKYTDWNTAIVIY
ncbi:MAG: L,D-transpeptidase [Chloroflexota bacterium]|nr:L,D-transpeptidase [Chloroflexota bacterium]